MKKLVKLSFLLLITTLVSCKSNHYPNLDKGLFADIQTDKGNILLQLAYESTPITVANFVALAEGKNPYVNENFKGKPFYDGLKFHRVVDNYIIQGGDPLANGRGGPGYVFEDEFPTNEDANLLLKHDKAGILSMANSGPAKNGSQFFITHKATSHLDGRHTVFGHVIKGQKVVDSITKGDIMNAIKIIRVGKDAKKFNAPKIFGNYFSKLEEEAKARLEKKQQAKEVFLKHVTEYKVEAEQLASGLQIYYIKKGKGISPKIGTKVKVNYEGYFTTGDLFDSNVKEKSILFDKYNASRDNKGGYAPIAMDYSPDARLIPGFREGLLKMNTGDRVMLFIPSHLAYGPQGNRSIPPDTDLIFVLEIVE